METADKGRSSIIKTERISRTTGRPLEFYEQFLGVTPTDFEGRKILNVGAGRSDINSELERRNIHPEVLINFDLAYKDVGDGRGVFKRVAGKALHKEHIPLNAAAGDMKRLPFADNELDSVIYLWSVCWLEGKDRPAAIDEAYRVCKEGGEVKIYPISFAKEAQKAIERYPFIQVSRPHYDIDRLFRSGMEDKDALGKIRQFLSNLDEIQIEGVQRLIAGMRGKQVGTLTIRKTPDVDQETFSNAIRELADSGFTF
jgi:ubiquinone/menaquinone biosynthesis C-methylase UbiE